jgi:hypothetical protein
MLVDISINGDGLRYKKKRKHNELMKLNEEIDNNKIVNNVKNSENIEMNRELNNIDIKKRKIASSQQQEKQLRDVKKSKEKLQIKTSISKDEGESSKQKLLESNNEFQMKPSNVVQENKIQLYRHRDKIEECMKKIIESFNKRRVELVQKAITFCQKNLKNVNKKQKIKCPKISKEGERLNIDYTLYPAKHSLINLEALMINCALSKYENYEELLEGNNPNIANCALFFYGVTVMIKIVNDLLQYLNNNIEKFTDTVIINLKSFDNMLNTSKNYCLDSLQHK